MKLETLTLIGLGLLLLARKKNNLLEVLESDITEQSALQLDTEITSPLEFGVQNIGGERGFIVTDSEGMRFSEQIVSQGVVKDPYGRIFTTAFPLLYLTANWYTSVENMLANYDPNYPVPEGAHYTFQQEFPTAYQQALEYARLV